MKKFNL